MPLDRNYQAEHREMEEAHQTYLELSAKPDRMLMR